LALLHFADKQLRNRRQADQLAASSSTLIYACSNWRVEHRPCQPEQNNGFRHGGDRGCAAPDELRTFAARRTFWAMKGSAMIACVSSGMADPAWSISATMRAIAMRARKVLDGLQS